MPDTPQGSAACEAAPVSRTVSCPTCGVGPGQACPGGASHWQRVKAVHVWTEPFMLMPALDGEACVVERCRTQSVTRWQVEVIGYDSRDERPDQGPTFTVCPDHLCQQVNRWPLDVAARRCTECKSCTLPEGHNSDHDCACFAPNGGLDA